MPPSPERFKYVWNDHCHQFDRSFVTDATLITTQQLEDRRRFLTDSAQPLRLVVAGRQIAIKATDHVLRAMKLAHDRGVRIELTVMGDGEDLDKFKSLAAELELNDIAHFVGTVPYGKPLFDAWAKTHVMVITNLTAEISRNVMLSMARGLPLIMYANPGTDELIRTSGAGTLVPKGNIDALANRFRTRRHQPHRTRHPSRSRRGSRRHQHPRRHPPPPRRTRQVAVTIMRI